MNYKTATSDKWEVLKPRARDNRKTQTLAESIVWNFLRNNQLGLKFRRQHAIHNYIVDFVALRIKLVIEIDGISHEDQIEYDYKRTKILNKNGFRVIRFTNEEVIGNGNLVEKRIKERVEGLLDEKIFNEQ